MTENEQLYIIANEAKEKAYAPYSHFKVGAALLTDDGIVFTGCNIENKSFGATNCAERTAIFKAISEGKNKFVKIAIASGDGNHTYPCGICRQVLAEFMPDGEIILCNDNKDIVVYKVQDLIPHMFNNNINEKK